MSWNDIANGVNSQLSPGENTISSLNTTEHGKIVPYGLLGDFADGIDKSAQRSYIEDGFIRNIKPRNMEVMLQAPDATILIKKRMFTSLMSNFRTDILNADEKLFIKASKTLFKNKCAFISAYEKLSKLDLVTEAAGGVNSYTLPLVLNAVDQLDALASGVLKSTSTTNLVNQLNSVRHLYKFSSPSTTTTWMADRDSTYNSDTGEGTGVIELTMFSDLSTAAGLKLGEGNANFTIEDPYKLMIITNEEIDKAISDATNLFNINNFTNLTTGELANTIGTSKTQLNEIRGARGAAGISFIIDQGALAVRTIRAIIDGEGREIIFTYNPGFLGIGGSVELDDSAKTGKNGLLSKQEDITNPEFPSLPYQSSEIDLFSKIIEDTYRLLKLQETTKSKIKKFNKQTNYVRKKMRLHFANKPIIQPMDSVHIYIGSKAEIDKKVSSSVGPSSVGAAYDISKMLNSIGNVFNNIAGYFNDSYNSYIDIEKNAIVGTDFPMWLYKSLRNDFTKEGAGVHVFGGLVSGADHSYGDGKYTLKVSVEENSSYFQNSMININPSVDVANHNLYDPVTPFNINFNQSSGMAEDKMPELLEENKRLLNSGILRMQNGPSRGSVLNLLGFNNPEKELSGATFRRVIHAPEGMVYRWKQGIGALTKTGQEINQPGFESESQPSISKDPFSGQDVLNVLSLLITGQPYNFSTFMRAAINSGSIMKDELNNTGYDSSFYRGLIDDITKQNQIWGNFIPFKKVILNKEAYAFLSTGEDSFVQKNDKLSSLMRKRADLFDQLARTNTAFAKNPNIFDFSNSSVVFNASALAALGVASTTSAADGDYLIQIAVLDAQINQIQNQFNAQLETSDYTKLGQLKIIGNEFSSSDMSIGGEYLDHINDAQNEFRKKINSLTLRRSWKVRANDDVNLFIVDDTYDKNYDIQAFEQSFSSNALSLFNSEYVDVLEKIKSVASISIGLEVFTDTQGHIQVRSPQYNRMPKSIFYKMMKNKQETGIQIFPEFLESLFANQIDDVTKQITLMEQHIRLNAAVLGYFNDDAAQDLIAGFEFVTNRKTGSVATNLRELVLQRHVDKKAEWDEYITLTKTKVQKATKSDRIFTVAAQAAAASKVGSISISPGEIMDSSIQEIRENIFTLTGKPAPTISELISNNSIPRIQTDIINVIEKISNLVSQRQRLVLVMANSLANLQEGTALDDDPNTSTSAMFPQLSTLKIPAILEHMIEDEDIDDIGPGSGSRYIIKDHQIISMNIRERAPEYTTVQVNGLFDPLAPSAPGGAELTGGGSAWTSAMAVDYDLWNMYGFKKPATVSAPFFTDPDTQCAPFAIYLLNLQRKKIFTGSLAIVGNEYMQPGDVIYIEDRDLLFYVQSVKHSFNYSGNGNFTTNLDLEFGHNPGEYIPTPLDIIGRSLYNSKFNSDEFRVDRFDNSNGDQSVGAVGFDDSDIRTGKELSNAVTNSKCGQQNVNTLINILLATNKIFDPSSLNKVPKLQLRYYFNSLGDGDITTASPQLATFANQIKAWFINPTTQNLVGDEKNVLPDSAVGMFIDDKNIEIISIDLAPGSDSKVSPSTKAFALTKILSGSELSIIHDNVKDSKVADRTAIPVQMYKNIIDMVVSFESPTETIETSTSESATDQYSQNIAQQVRDAINTMAGKTP